MKNTVIIIGSGIGGLSTAVRLLSKGYKVKVLEKNETIGGKTNKINSPLVSFDLTASIPIMIDEYLKLFNEIGKDYKNYLQLIPLDTIYNVFDYKGNIMEIHKNLNLITYNYKTLDEKYLSEYISFLEKTYKKYKVINNEFLARSQQNIYNLFNLKTIVSLIKLNPLITCSSYINKYINNDMLRKFLLFQSMYIGVSPYSSSNMYTLIPAISQIEGLYHIKGGTYKYIETLKKLILEFGGEIETNIEVNEILIENNKAVGVSTSKGNLFSSIIVCNADFSYAIKELLPNNKHKYTYDKINSFTYSCSTFILHLGIKNFYKSLNIHNIFIGNNFKENIIAPFKGIVPTNGSYYIYYPSKIDNTFNKIGYTSLNVMLRVPNLLYRNITWTDDFISKLRNKIIKDLSQIHGLENIEKDVIYEDYTTPLTFKNKFNTYGGCAFGLSHTLTQTNFFRPQCKLKDIKSLYFVGASTHPGNGVSLVLKSSALCVKEILKEL